MRKIERLLTNYGEHHTNLINKVIHWICVTSIMFSLIGLIMSIPFVSAISWWLSWAGVFLLLVLIYYLRLSFAMFLGFLPIAFVLLKGNYWIFESIGNSSGKLAIISLIIFTVAWIGQFIGHKIEGKKPSFLQDVQYLLIGPAWLLHFIYRKIGIPY